MEQNATYGIYIHILPNNKKYIGITSQKPISKRWAKGKGYKSNAYFTNAINKYGWENIEHKILFENLSKQEAEQKEIELIEKYKSNNKQYGYNIENGGKANGRVSDETKEKISKKTILFWQSEEYREKQRTAHIGKMPNNKGRKHTEEEKNKIRQNYRYHASNKGKHLSEETKLKISLKNKGKKISDEHKKRLHEGSIKAAKNRQKPILCVEKNIIYESLKIASLENKTHHANIIKVLNGERKTAGGYHWKAIN